MPHNPRTPDPQATLKPQAGDGTRSRSTPRAQHFFEKCSFREEVGADFFHLLTNIFHQPTATAPVRLPKISGPAPATLCEWDPNQGFFSAGLNHFTSTTRTIFEVPISPQKKK